MNTQRSENNHLWQALRATSLCALACLICLVYVATASAQTGTSTVRGTVQDAQGNAVAGATVTLRNDEKNFVRTQTTSDDGGYTFAAVPPDVYRVEVEATGFKKLTVGDVRALVDTPTEIDASLEVGGVNEEVTISASTDAPLNTTDATIGTTFESARIQELPLNGRNVVNLLSLQPGVTRDGEVNGARRDQANITLDGLDVNEQQSGLDIVSGEAFSSVLRSTIDSVQEFRVTTSVPNANQGRSSGAQVSLVTRSGSNEFHGGLFEYHRNTATNANDYFNNAVGSYTADDLQVQLGFNRVGEPRLPTPKLIRNIFGGYLGGPIVRNRMYFFYNYEGLRDASETSVLQTVPTASLRAGIVRYRNTSGGITTLTPANIAALYPATGGVNPAGLALLQTAPLPNSTEIGDGLNTGGFRFNARNDRRLNTHIGRLDFIINDRQLLFARGNYQDDFYTQPSQFPGAAAPNLSVTPKGFVVGHTWTVSDSVINNLRVGLTRQAFTQGSDVEQNSVNFRFVYQPFTFQRQLRRTTPVFNITDDVSYVRGNHSFQFGTNIRFIRNNRTSFGNAFDTAIVNPSFFAGSGSSLTRPLTGVSNQFDTRAAIAAVLGRFSQYSVTTTYDLNGNPLPAGSPTVRSFATEEYDFYGQDSWRIRPNLTLTYGLRWGINTPVYERGGYQVAPNVNLGEFFERRRIGADQGTPVNDLITVNRSGPENNGPDYYRTDKNNFAPNVSVAWSPDFGDNAFGRLVGRDGKSVIRGGFRMVYDRVGSALAVQFDLNNSLGFVSDSNVSANTFNVTTNPGPRFTGIGQNYRAFPGISVGGPITFPLTVPADSQRRIEQTIDSDLTTPVQYTWNLSYGRELPKGLSFELSYTGRSARNLLLVRDTMHLNNLRDPRSGQTWYEAAGILADYRARGLAFDTAPAIPFFENLFPGLGDNLLGDASLSATQAAYFIVARDGFDLPDWTFVQDLLDPFSNVGTNAFFHPQYGAFGAYSSIGSSDYHGGSVSVRQRFGNSFLFDFNYTLSKSMDDGSTLESSAILSTLVRQPLDLREERSVSDFDVRHNINANFIAELPFGRNRRFFNDMPKVLDAIFGGWQLSGVFRYNSGLPLDAPNDIGLWATNWQLTSNGVRLRDIIADNNSNVDGSPNVFSNPRAAYAAFRNARAGERGDRNILRIPSYISLDPGLAKTFRLPFGEDQTLQFRWDVFNVTNTQRFEGLAAFGLNADPNLNPGDASADFGRYITTQRAAGETRSGRVMQFALRYRF